MRTPIYLRRGNKADLPTLLAGEPGFATDTKELFLGHSLGNLLIFTDVKSLAASGYQKLPGGLILQWGRFTKTGVLANTNTIFPVNLPITFPTGILRSIKTGGGLASPNVFVQDGESDTASALSFNVQTTTAQDVYVAYLAIGN